jgi:hypothetical protein
MLNHDHIGKYIDYIVVDPSASNETFFQAILRQLKRRKSYRKYVCSL